MATVPLPKPRVRQRLRNAPEALNCPESLKISRSSRKTPLMNYVDATDTSARKTGQIKLHVPDAFSVRRKSGALVAQCLDELVPIVRPGIFTSQIDEFVRKFSIANNA